MAREMFEPGMVFDPTDEELVFHYLTEKMSGSTEREGFYFFKNIQLYQHEPSQLPDLAQDSGQQKWYFFTNIKRKHQQGTNISRQVEAGGFWRKTGQRSFINDKDGKQTATKTSLTYYNNQSEKTRWLMKEYILLESQSPNPNDEESEMLTLCYVYRSKMHRRSNRGRSTDVNNN